MSQARGFLRAHWQKGDVQQLCEYHCGAGACTASGASRAAGEEALVFKALLSP